MRRNAIKWSAHTILCMMAGMQRMKKGYQTVRRFTKWKRAGFKDGPCGIAKTFLKI